MIRILVICGMQSLFELVLLVPALSVQNCIAAQCFSYFNREKKKSKLDEFTNDFAKELMEYKKIQKERRRSYSR